MGVVSFRLSDADEAILATAGVKPAQLAKDAAEQAAQRLRTEETLRVLDRYGKPAPGPVAELVRAIRAEH